MKKNLLRVILIFALANLSFFQTSAAVNFSAEESATTVYHQGFDTADDFATWKLTSTSSTTWKIQSKSVVSIVPDFSTINPDSQNTLVLNYGSGQNETITSPEMEIKAGSKCSFYTCFDGVYIYWAPLTLNVIEEETGVSTTLFNAFLWSQETGHEREKWLQFEFDLSDYAGKKVRFAFNVTGDFGSDIMVDDFKIKEVDASGVNPIEILEGQEIHFIDTSDNAVSWNWTFEGAETETSTEQNPIVKYNVAGTYDVALSISNGTSEESLTKTGYVIVKGVAPTAKIGYPEVGYQSPWVACFVPTDMPVQFKDLSEGNPNEWNWIFTGTDNLTSTEQNPEVTFVEKGVHSVDLKVKNSTGENNETHIHSIQAGGEQYVWNIGSDEYDFLDKIGLGWYGNYGGTNWLDIYGWAEHFEKPMKKATISKVQIYFASITNATPEADITVSISKMKDGFPCDTLTSVSVKVKDLQYSDVTFLPTDFVFSNPVEIDEEFFVIVGGFPNNDGDDIAMFCARREDPAGKSTVYQYQAILDDNYQPTSENEWVKNVDEAVSFALSPMLNYDDLSGIEEGVNDVASANAYVANGELVVPEGADLVEVYTIAGQKVVSVSNVESSLPLNLSAGVYVIRVQSEGESTVLKAVVK